MAKSQREATLTIAPKRKMIDIEIPADIHVGDIVGVCSFLVALITGMQGEKPQAGHRYIVPADYEKMMNSCGTTIDEVVDILIRMSYRFKFKKGKSTCSSCGCAFVTGYESGSRGAAVSTIFGNAVNEFLDGKLTIAEAIQKHFE